MKAEKIIFVIKNRSKLPLSISEKKRLNKIVSKIAASNRTALFQTCDDQLDLAIMVKNGIGKGRSELYNIFCGDITDCVSHTIEYIEKYTPVEKIIIIFIDNREFIIEFAKQKFGKKLNYDPATDYDNIKIMDCEDFTVHSA